MRRYLFWSKGAGTASTAAALRLRNVNRGRVCTQE
jgi:hypothetical protein